MCKLLNISTRGRLNCNPLNKSTLGLISCNNIQINKIKFPKKDIGGFENTRYKSIPFIQIDKEENFYEMIKREDKEILLIIKMFMKCH